MSKKNNIKTKKNRSCVNTLNDIIYAGGTNTFRLIRALKNAVSEIQRMRQEIQRMRHERDEARRLVCELAAAYKAEMFCSKGTMVPKSDRALAKAYGWDCFKKDTES